MTKKRSIVLAFVLVALAGAAVAYWAIGVANDSLGTRVIAPGVSPVVPASPLKSQLPTPGIAPGSEAQPTATIDPQVQTFVAALKEAQADCPCDPVKADCECDPVRDALKRIWICYDATDDETARVFCTLVRVLESEDAGVREAAAQALEKISWSVPNLLEWTTVLVRVLEEDEDAGVREEAADALGRIGWRSRQACSAERTIIPDSVLGQAIPALVRALEEDEDAGVREEAAEALGGISQYMYESETLVLRQAIPVLVRALEEDEDAGVRRAAAWALGNICGSRFVEHCPAEAVLALAQTLENQDTGVREAATGAFVAIGHKAVSAVPMLIQILQNEDAGVREAAAGALGGIGPKAADAVPALALALEDENVDVREFIPLHF